MLFDLTSKGRRRTVKAVYLTLAVLMGGGLVLFGIGGEVSGGLVDGIFGNRSNTGDVTKRYEASERRALEATKRDPQDGAAWAELARARVRLASDGDNFDRDKGRFTPEGTRKLEQATAAWEKHVEVADKPDASLAALMTQAYSSLGEPAKAAQAQEIIVEARPDKAGLYATLAIYAYAANQDRKGDLAAERALKLTPADQRPRLRADLDQVKQQRQLPAGMSPPPADEGN